MGGYLGQKNGNFLRGLVGLKIFGQKFGGLVDFLMFQTTKNKELKSRCHGTDSKTHGLEPKW